MIADDDAALATKVKVAIEKLDMAIKRLDEARAAGMLLIQAKFRHPRRKDFVAFLKRAGGVQYSRAMELIAIARDCKTYAEIKAKNAARQRRHYAKTKKARPLANGHAEDASVSAETRKAEYASPEKKAEAVSTKNLAEFEYACRAYLPRLNAADLAKAQTFFDGEMTKWKSQKQAAD